MEPQVPGALGKYPRPNQIARRSEMRGLGPRVERVVLGSVDTVIASRVSQQADQSQEFNKSGARKFLMQVLRSGEVEFPNLVFGFAAVGQIQNDGFAVAFFAVVFIEDGFGHYIFFAGPISQVAFAATFAAKWEFRVNSRICGSFTYRAFVLHVVLPGL
jgi:hypothetical protein